MSASEICILGDQGQGGTYLLHIHLQTDISLAFGRFRGGKTFSLPAGAYLYVGSALNSRGATSLAPRLLRHATRSGARPPHPIRVALCETFQENGLGTVSLHPPQTKKLHWNVDHLLDQPDAELVGVYVIRHPARLEEALAQWLGADPYTSFIIPGLGANDVRGGTHVLFVTGDVAWWAALPGRINAWFMAPNFPTPPKK